MNTQDLQDMLRERGIADIATTYGWQSDGNGWRYPIVDESGNVITHRWKNATANGPKYRWDPNKPDRARYYLPPNGTLATAIRDADGELYIASGEPDVLALRAAGIRNVISWFGENNVPVELGTDLVRWNVKRVIVFPDRDQTGTQFAQKIHDRLYTLDIQFFAYELPEELGAKGDLNDLWIHQSFDRSDFQAYLNHLRQTPAARQLFETPHPTRHTTDNCELPTRFIDEIEAQLRQHGVDRYNQKHFSNPVRCLFKTHEHDDRRPASHWHQNDHFFYCHKCGRSWNAKETGEQFNLWLADYYDQPSPTQVSSSIFDAGPASDEPYFDQPLDTLQAYIHEHVQDLARPSQNGGYKVTQTVIGRLIMGFWDDEYAYFYEDWHRYRDDVWSKTENVRGIVWDACEVCEAYGIKPRKGLVTSVLDYMQQQLQVPDQDVDRNEHILNFQNGLFNLETGTLKPHRSDYYSTSQLSIRYQPDATCPTWISALDHWFDDQSTVQLLQEAFGYSLTTDTHFEKAFWLYGKPATGKSTILRVIQALLESNCVSIPMEQIAQDRSYLSHLVGKRVAICSEAQTDQVIPDHLFKQISSGETMTIRPLYKNPFDASMTVKLWWAMNTLPANRDRSKAIERRLLIIPCQNTIPAHEQDPNLIDKLLQELPGIFNWAYEGLTRLRHQNGFTTAESTTQLIEEYQRTNDVEQLFVDEACVIDHYEMTKSSDLYDAYSVWCKRNGHRRKASNQVSQEWERLGFKKTRRRDGNYYTGLCLNPVYHAKVNRDQRDQGFSS